MTIEPIERLETRRDIASSICTKNVWDKFPTNDDRDLFVWSDDRCHIAAKKYATLRHGYNLDALDVASDELMAACKHLMELFEWKRIVTIPYFTYASLLADIFEYNIITA